MTDKHASWVGQPQPVVSEIEWKQRKKFVRFDENDEAILREPHLVARSYADEIMEALYQRWLQVDELRGFFTDPAILARRQGHAEGLLHQFDRRGLRIIVPGASPSNRPSPQAHWAFTPMVHVLLRCLFGIGLAQGDGSV